MISFPLKSTYRICRKLYVILYNIYKYSYNPLWYFTQWCVVFWKTVLLSHLWLTINLKFHWCESQKYIDIINLILSSTSLPWKIVHGSYLRHSKFWSSFKFFHKKLCLIGVSMLNILCYIFNSRKAMYSMQNNISCEEILFK